MFLIEVASEHSRMVPMDGEYDTKNCHHPKLDSSSINGRSMESSYLDPFIKSNVAQLATPYVLMACSIRCDGVGTIQWFTCSWYARYL